MDGRSLEQLDNPQNQSMNQQTTRRFYQHPTTKVTMNPRCPPIDMEFMWKLFHSTKSVDARISTKESQAKTLKRQGFPMGLASSILQHAVDHPLRIWLVDNCGTMHRNDGHKVVQSSKKIEVVQCSRWEEITSSVIWHAEMAAWCQNPTAIRLMKDPGNHVGPQQVGICASKHITSPEELKRAKDLLRRTRPVGASSPINFHLLEIISSTQYLIPILEQTQSRLVLHICTDSIPSDPEGHELPELKAGLRTILLQLIDMPIQVVLRLSTDDERVVDFYKEMAYEALFVKRLQVIDDFVSECAQVKRWNPWMNYGYPLHLCREGGVYVPAVEQLSHRKLLVPEVIEVLALVLGIVVDSKTYIPSIDYDGLRKQIKTLNEKTGKCWSPISSSYVPWINMKQLDKLHNVDGCTIS